MKIVNKFFPLLVLITLCLPISAQVLDGAYMREHVVERSFVPYPEIREADAMYSKKILRVLELREKQNHPLYFPILRMTYPGTGEDGTIIQPQRSRVNLIWLMYNIGILGELYDMRTGELVDTTYGKRYPVYKLDASDITNWWRQPIDVDDELRENLLAYKEKILVPDGEGGTYEETIDSKLDDTRALDKLWVWEEWVFDKQRSVMDVQIIAIAPDGWVVKDETVERVWPFWIWFRDYRPLFASYEVFNSHNDAEHRTFDDIFFKRKFSSYIVAESNNYDNRLISDYLLGIDAIREGERIQEKISLMEHDQWEY
ncbi:MAG: gliding motility protein GldN [Bacteroidales bacterium]|jgi:gliding motility associated protien GldN|nr:gliding motility protein GldN [Bacteroidales bacterium]MCK9498183.1 gliding motility protein GldN [Bacteroidales bacterium]MDY0313502.1 gliding motility protein GldN [Bacteroidales bacterium]NLB87514.1 gliding motility protein GldN [Bacteroidales bacterium]